MEHLKYIYSDNNNNNNVVVVVVDEIEGQNNQCQLHKTVEYKLLLTLLFSHILNIWPPTQVF